MKIKTLLCALLMLNALLLAGRAWAQDTVYWHPDRPLTWAQFRGVPPAAPGPLAAESRCALAYSGSARGQNGKLRFDLRVRTYFLPADSWVRPDRRTARLLAHEQLHFDIAELYARRLHQQFDRATFTAQNYAARSRKVFEENWRAYQAYQRQYDAETDHGLKTEAQARWQITVARALAE